MPFNVIYSRTVTPSVHVATKYSFPRRPLHANPFIPMERIWWRALFLLSFFYSLFSAACDCVVASLSRLRCVYGFVIEFGRSISPIGMGAGGGCVCECGSASAVVNARRHVMRLRMFSEARYLMTVNDSNYLRIVQYFPFFPSLAREPSFISFAPTSRADTV